MFHRSSTVNIEFFSKKIGVYRGKQGFLKRAKMAHFLVLHL